MLTVFSNLLEKLYSSRLLKVVNEHSVLHDCQFCFRTAKSTSTAIAHVVTSSINKINYQVHSTCLA